jgi:hypothetical protein
MGRHDAHSVEETGSGEARFAYPRNVKRELLDWSALVASERGNFKRRLRRRSQACQKYLLRVDVHADARRTR